MNTNATRLPKHWDYPFQLHLRGGQVLRLISPRHEEEGSALSWLRDVIASAVDRPRLATVLDWFLSESQEEEVLVNLLAIDAITCDPALPVYEPTAEEKVLPPFHFDLELVTGNVIHGALDGATCPEDVLRMLPECESGRGVVLSTADGGATMVRMAHVVKIVFKGHKAVTAK